jgi:nucleotide-binding universal stress UspA family protein
MSWLPKKKVVVPIDFSEHSSDAAETALDLVADAADLYLIHVLPVLTDYEAGLVWANTNEEARQRHAEQALREQFADPRWQGLHIEIAFGDPGHAIAEHAEAVGAELIVLSSHGRTGLTRLLIGSVAERVVRLAHCAVLVIKASR